MVLKLKPKFLRFPGGCYVEGKFLSNAYRWKQTIGPWENRSGHHSDVWGYWSDDGLGYLEYLQLAEDLEAEPVWVVNSGIAYGKDEIDTSLIAPFVQEMLDSIEFARGSRDTRWGSRRAKLGHPAPFRLNYVAIGNENCDRKFYRALKNAYPDINIISNCDGSEKPLDHPADLYDYHTYPDVLGMLNLTHHFDKKRSNDPRAPKAFVSEYAVTNPPDKVKNGSFEAALAEAAFLLSLEQNRQVQAISQIVFPLLIDKMTLLTWLVMHHCLPITMIDGGIQMQLFSTAPQPMVSPVIGCRRSSSTLVGLF
ncbi:Alpha-L-arabinofuranosidase 1 [Bienertia sinuspersici]